MKNRTDQFLLAGFLLSLIFYTFLLLSYSTIVSSFAAPEWLRAVCIWLALSFHAVPIFCLQALLCRTAKWSWLKFIPLCLLSLAAFVGGMYLSGVWGSSWDSLGGAFILLWCLAPAAGCCLGWMSEDHKLGRWTAAAGLALLLAVYVWLKSKGGSLWYFEPIDLAALIVLAIGLYFLLRKTDKKNPGE